MKVIFNPDRSTFKQLYANREYVVPPGKSKFPDKVADHLVESLKMWAVVHWVGEESEKGARIKQVDCLNRHYKEILDNYTARNKDYLASAAALGIKVTVPEEVAEARAYLNAAAGEMP